MFKEKWNILDFIKRYLISFFVVLAIFSTLFFFGATEIFFGNILEFKFKYIDIVGLLIFQTLLYSLPIALVITILPQKYQIRNRILSFCIIIGLIIWVQSAFLSKNDGILDGRAATDLFSIQSITSAVIFILLIFLSIIFYKYIIRFAVPMALIILLAQTAAVTPSIIDTLTVKETKEEIRYTTYIDKKMFEFSKQQNVIFIVLDSLDQQYIDSTFESEKYRNYFKDFKYFTDYAGVYKYTNPTGSVQIAGKVYDNKILYSDFLEKSFKSPESLVKNLKDKNWSLRIYGIPVYYLSPDFFANVGPVNSAIKYTSKDIQKLLYGAFFRAAPKPLKAEVETVKAQAEWDFWFMDKINQIQFTNESKQPVFFLVHLLSAHPPYVVNDNLKNVKNSTPQAQTKSSLTMINSMLDKMREAGVYDNSLIIITGDHGNEGMRVNPTLMIKGFNESHEEPIEINTAFYQKELPAALLKFVDGKYKTASDIPTVKDRLFYDFEWTDDWAQGYIGPLYEYSIAGKANDASKYIETGNIFPPIMAKVKSANIKLNFPEAYDNNKYIFSTNWKKTKTGVSTYGIAKNGVWITLPKDENSFRIKTTITYKKPKLYKAKEYKTGFFCNNKWFELTVTNQEKKFVCDSYYSDMLRMNFSQPIELTQLELETTNLTDIYTFPINKEISVKNIPAELFNQTWHIKESEHIWTNSQKSTLSLPLLETADSGVIASLCMEGYVSKNTPQTVTISAKDENLASIVYNKSFEPSCATFMVAPKLIDPNNVLHLKILSSYMGNPAEDGISDDQRHLGVSLRSIKFVSKKAYSTNMPITTEMLVNNNVSKWHGIEGDGVWTASQKSILRLSVEAFFKDDMNVTFAMYALLGAKFEKQNTKFYINDKQIGACSFTQEQNTAECSLRLSEKDYKNKNFLDIIIKSENKPISPKQIDPTLSDDRMLGIRLNNIKITYM